MKIGKVTLWIRMLLLVIWVSDVLLGGGLVAFLVLSAGTLPHSEIVPVRCQNSLRAR